MKTQGKTQQENEELKAIVKAVYKAVYKNITLRNKKRKKDTKEIVRDILDPNYTAEVDPDTIPNEKRAVLNKGKSAKQKEKGVKKLKKYCMKKNRCWEGYEPTPGKKAYSEGSCRKK